MLFHSRHYQKTCISNFLTFYIVLSKHFHSIISQNGLCYHYSLTTHTTHQTNEHYAQITGGCVQLQSHWTMKVRKEGVQLCLRTQ